MENNVLHGQAEVPHRSVGRYLGQAKAIWLVVGVFTSKQSDALKRNSGDDAMNQLNIELISIAAMHSKTGKATYIQSGSIFPFSFMCAFFYEPAKLAATHAFHFPR